MRIGKWRIVRTRPVPVEQPLLPGLLITEDLAAQHLSAETRTVIARVVRGMVKDLLGDLNEAPDRLITPPVRAHLEQLAEAAANRAILSHVFGGINVLEVPSDANPLAQQRSDGAQRVWPANSAGDPPTEPTGS